MSIQIDMTCILKDKVREENTALALGSGSLRVYGTPAMMLLVERTAVTLLEGNLEPGMTSVGTSLNMEHVAATPVGMEVSCQVWLAEINKRKLVFEVEVRDETGLIGKGSHERFIVQANRFQEKADGKRKS